MKMKFKTDGFYSKLLVAYSKLFDLVYSAKCGARSLVVEVYVKNRWYESILDVYKEG